MRVLIVPDKFKGTLSAPEACAAMAAGWHSARPMDALDLLPMSDGGDGFGEVMGGLLNAQLKTVGTVDAAHRPVAAHWWWVPEQRLAIIEAARVVGLARLPRGRFHPFQLDTFGLGGVFKAALRTGAARCLIGIGGSATNDGGFGLARGLGWKFLDADNREIDQWWQLGQLARVQRPAQPLGISITVATDVVNPLLGAKGCTRVYGPQKGLRPDDLLFAEQCLRRLNAVVTAQLKAKRATQPGAGAAGGLGFGLMVFARASQRPGFDVFADAAGLAARIRKSDLVITGEGALDRQSFMGKGVGRVLELCRRHRRPAMVLAGRVDISARTLGWGISAGSLTELAGPAKAVSQPKLLLKKLSARTALNYCP